AWMEDERAHARHLEDRLLENELAARDGQVGPSPFEERLCLRSVRRLHEDSRHVLEARRIARAQPLELGLLPRRIPPREREPCVRAKRDDVEEPEHADAFDLT